MASEINDLKGILILILFAIPKVAATNINCSGRAFHCVNSTHFMICVDLGGGVSTTIDDFVIPCPARTVCNENNIFECDFPEDPTPPLQVIDVNKQSDTSEPTSVTNSVTTPTQTSEIYSVFNENIAATSLPIPEDVTPALKLQVFENIKNSAGGNTYNTTETSVPSSFIGSANETVKDKQTSNITLTTSATDKNSKNLETAVVTSILEAVNASSTDKSTPNDTVTSVIGLINLISTDPPGVESTNRSFNVLTSLDSSYDIIASTTEHYITKEVTIHSDKVKNVTEGFNIPTEIILNEITTNADAVSPIPVINTLIVNEINNEFENIIKTNSGNHMIAEQNNFGKSNNTNKLLTETTTEYLAPITTINISEPITVDLSRQTTTGSAFGLLGPVEIISAEPNQSISSINDYIDTSYSNTATTTMTDLFNTKLETTLSGKPVTAKVISTTPITNLIVQNVINNSTTTKLNPTSDISIIETVQETKTNYYVPEPITESLQTTTEKTSVPVITETNIKYTTAKIATSEALFNNDSRVQKPTIVAQPLEIIRSTDSPTVVTDNLYQINENFNQTLISTENVSVDTMNTTETPNSVYTALGIDVKNNKKVTEPILVLLPSVKNSLIDITTVETLRNGFTTPAIEVPNESTAINVASSVNESSLLDNTTNTVIITETPKMVFNVSSSNSESSTIEYTTIEILTTETLQNENRSPANDLMSVHTTPAPYSVISGTATNKTAKDFTSQSEIDTNLHIGYTQEINVQTAPDGHSSVDLGTTQRTMTDPENKIPEPLNQLDTLKAMMLPEILNSDQWTNNIPDEVSTTQSNLNNIEIRVTTPFPSEFIENAVISNIVKFGNQDNSSATSLVNIQEVPLKIIGTSAPLSNHYVTELSSTTAATVHTTPRTDSTKTFIQASTNTPKIANIYTVSVTDNKIKTSSLFSEDVTRPTNVEIVTDSPTRTVPQQELLNRKNNTNTTAITPATVTTAGYVLDTNNIDLNISNKKDSVNTENTITKDSIIKKTEILNPIYDNNSGNPTFIASTEKTKKDENIEIKSVLNIVNPSGNAMAIEMLQPTSTNSSLSNDYIKTSESQGASVYVTATDNEPEYNSVHVVQSVQKNPDASVPFAETKLMNSSTPNTHTFPVTELSTEPVQYVSTESPILSTNSITIAADYVAAKTNDYFATEAMVSQLNKLTNMQAETSAGLVKSITPATAVTPNGVTTVPVYDEITTIKDSAFIISSNQMPPQIVADVNIKMSTEPPRLTSKVMEPQSVKTTESSLPISELPVAQMIEPTHKTLDNTIQTVQPGTETTDLPQYVTSTVSNNILRPLPSLSITGVTASEMTTEPIPTTIIAQTTPLDNTNQNVLQTIDLPQHLISTIKNNIPQSMPSLPKVEDITAQITIKPTNTTELAQAILYDKTNQNILKTTDLPQYVTSIINNNIPQSVPSLPILEVTAAERTTEPTQKKLFVTKKPGTTNQKVQPVLKITDLPQYVTSTANNNISKSIPMMEATASQMTTPLETNQNIQPGVKTTVLPQYVSTVNKNIPQLIPSLPIVEVTAAERTTEPTHATILAQTTPPDMTNQNVQPGTKTTDFPEYVTSKVNSDIPQSMPSLTTAQMTTERTLTILAQTTPLTATGNPNQNEPGIKTTDLPQYVLSTVNKLKTIDFPQYVISRVNNTIPQQMPSLHITGVTTPQITTEPTDTINAFAVTPPLAAAGKADPDIVPGIKTAGLPQYITVPYSNAQSITDITTETITVPDSMVENIKVVEDKISGTHQGETILSDVMYNTPTVNSSSVKSVKHIIDHESIVVGATSKNYKQNTPITAAYSVNINKAEIVNHTDSNWMPSDVNIDTIKIKESSVEEEDSKTPVLKLGTDEANKNLDLDSAIISVIQPKDGKSIDKIEYRLTTVVTDNKQAKTPKNVTQSKTTITSENNNAEIDSSVNVNIEIIDVKTNQVQVQSKNISDSYSLNDTKDINTISHHNLSLQNSAINYDLEQHLIAANHTITTEVQSHLNESDKQINKTSKEPAINGTSVHNPFLTSTQNASSKDTVPDSVLNCSNHTRGKYSDKKDCRKFYTCVGTLQPIIGTCPNNTVFSEINKQCTRNLSHCVRNNQFRCLFEGRFTDFFKDNIYYICVKNRNNHFIRYKLQCKEDYHLNKDSIKCEKNKEISTQSGSSVSETINDESKPGPKSEKIIVISDDFACVKEGKFPNANDCSKYYICVKNRNNQFIRYKLQCQDGYHLNKDSVKCEKNEEISQSVSETISSDESKPKPKLEKYVTSDDFECDEEGKFPHAKDCSKYYVCTKVKNVYRRKITKCASYDVFDKKEKKCVESDSGEC